MTRKTRNTPTNTGGGVPLFLKTTKFTLTQTLTGILIFFYCNPTLLAVYLGLSFVAPAAVAIVETFQALPKPVVYVSYCVGWWRIDWYLYRQKQRGKALWEMIGWHRHYHDGAVKATKTRKGILVQANTGQSTAEIVGRLREFTDRNQYQTVTALNRANPWAECFLWTKDPLNQAHQILAPEEIRVDTRQGIIHNPASGEDGEDVPIKFKNISGILVGGISGSGKTLSMLTALYPYFLQGTKTGDVKLFLADGKGGGDWMALKPIATNHNTDDITPEEMANLTRKLHTTMLERYKKLNLDGKMNAWNNETYPHIVLLLDECQTWLTTQARTKEELNYIKQTTRYLTELLKKGRAVKITVILITQKTDAEAIPTTIRDQTQLRIAFRQPNKIGDTLILGEIPDETPRPSQIKQTIPGTAITTNNKGNYQRIRFHYITENTAQKWTQQAIHEKTRKYPSQEKPRLKPAGTPLNQNKTPPIKPPIITKTKPTKTT